MALLSGYLCYLGPSYLSSYAFLNYDLNESAFLTSVSTFGYTVGLKRNLQMKNITNGNLLLSLLAIF